MFKIFKKMLFGKPAEEPVNTTPSITKKIYETTDGFLNFTKEKILAAQEEFGVIKSKMSNLLETNYNLGLRHLEKGNISEAIFRFRFIRKFWPNCFDAHYYLAYCLALNKRFYEAKKVLTELLIKNPNYDKKAQELLTNINASIGDNKNT